MRRRCMSAFTFNGYINFIGAGHYLSAAETELSCFELRMYMQTEDGLRRWILQYTFFDHNAGASGIAFFTGLKDQFYGAFPFIFQFLQNFCGAQQAGGMHI